MAEQMSSRERMLAAINHQPLDRVPTDIWATPEVWQKLQDHFKTDQAGVIEALGIDYIANPGPAYIGPPLPEIAPYDFYKIWGIATRKVDYGTGAYDEICHYPMAKIETIDDLKDFPWPQAEWFDFKGLAPEVKRLRQKHVVRIGYMAPFFLHTLTRGMEAAMMDPYRDPDFTHYLVGRISDYTLDYHRRLFEACAEHADLAEVTDDLGSQTGPLMSMEIFREFYKPHMQKMIDLSKEFGLKVFHHDDGGIRPFIPELIEMGVDVLNPIQAYCPGMEMTALKQDFGDTLCFHSAVDNQKVIPFGTPEDVRAEVRKCIDALASDKTGYICAPCHNLQPVTPVENIIALFDEARCYGQFD